MRDDQWLAERLNQIWQMLFPEVERQNNVIIRFKGKWKNKFGHIKRLKNQDTEIVVNGLFKNELIPEYIIDTTIAHELVHYSHGFQSPLPKRYKHPHAGGIVRRELLRRGFGNVFAKEKIFVKKEWPKMFQELCPEKTYTKKRIFRFSFF